MEAQNSLETPNIQPQSTVPDLPDVCVPTTLRDGESYHVFISYSSTDYQWTHSLINHLESYSLQVCYHERDFTPGRTVLENMSECIQESQKVLLVLSQEFVRSRWCLLEANMSLFRDCLERKPIIPVMLQSEVQVPVHLCHLTYLEANDPDFINKLLKVLCTPNQQLQGSTVVPFQPPSIYNGKALQPLTAVNDEGLNKWDSGQFSDMEVPDQLRLVIEDKDKYREALRIVNSVSQTKVWLRPVWVRVLIYIAAVLFSALLIAYFVVIGATCPFRIYSFPIPGIYYISTIMIIFICTALGLIIQISLWKKDDEKYIVRELQKAIGKANTLLSAEKVLMGCQSNSKIHLVYVSLDGCKQEFGETFRDHVSAEEMFQRALHFFSSGYACCLAKRHFPFPQLNYKSHLEGGVCFCQYVSQQLNKGEWK
ncbi:uncharacterized protein LOC121646891 isoform X2 [Melanotaenia boesemani]|uniref:uncharacterized protein LOC121646891 isoform X2 n=1 Tax=Melanotaenia boesemani TaxID=1250792 RepID=UPI001C041F4D|nr:uncharacterized protein LOC121646891 isoform X2 [Melanotaenia boesemani]